MVRELIEKAIALLGSQAKLADACGVKQPSIWQAKETEQVSAELAIKIEQATAGKITARELRPDLPWPEYAPSDRANENADSPVATA